MPLHPSAGKSLLLPATLLAIALLLALLHLTGVEVRDMRMVAAEGETPIQLPFDFPAAPQNALVTYRGVVEWGALASPRLWLWGDDCVETLEIDGRPVQLPDGRRCDFQRGFGVKIEQLSSGPHDLRLQVRNLVGSGTLRIDTDITPAPDRLRTWLQIGLILLSLGLLARGLGHTRLAPALGWVLIGALLLLSGFLLNTRPETFSYDVTGPAGHLAYIRHIVEQHALPDPHSGWEFHQPPLYYLAAALIYGAAQVTGLADPEVALQVFSLALFGLFLFASLRALELLLPDRRLLLPVALALAFWPSGVIHAIRIGNDGASCALFALAFWQMLRWRLENAPKAFGWALLWSALALLTKLNGVMLFGLLALGLMGQAEPGRLRRIALLAAGGTAAFLLGFGDNLLGWLDHPQNDPLLGIVPLSLNQLLKVDGSAAHFFAFDFRNYVGQPFVTPWWDGFGRQEFWNYLLKSSLFGEFGFHFPGSRPLGLLMGDLLLGMALFTLAGILLLEKKEWPRAWLPLAYLAFGFALLIAFKSRLPVAPHGDFRLIYALLPPLLYFHALALRRAESAGLPVLILLGRAMPIALAFASVLFFALHLGFEVFG